jgi:hypothetical protein
VSWSIANRFINGSTARTSPIFPSRSAAGLSDEPIVVFQVFNQNLNAGTPDAEEIDDGGHAGLFPLARPFHITQGVERVVDALAYCSQFFQGSHSNVANRWLPHRIDKSIDRPRIQQVIEHRRGGHLSIRIRMSHHLAEGSDRSGNRANEMRHQLAAVRFSCSRHQGDQRRGRFSIEHSGHLLEGSGAGLPDGFLFIFQQPTNATPA